MVIDAVSTVEVKGKRALLTASIIRLNKKGNIKP